MSRPVLSLYDLDRPALVTLSNELRSGLKADDRAAVARTLELGAGLASRIAEGPRVVDWFLRPEGDAEAAPIFGSLRRVAKKRALSLAWTSEEPSLEGRLRQYDVLRDVPGVAQMIDKLLDPARLPWFLIRPGATAGWLDSARRERLVAGLSPLRAALTKELSAFVEAISDAEGDVVIHDML